MHGKTLAQLLAALARREVSSVELTRLFLERIERHAALNAYITVDPERALAQAGAADALRAQGGDAPLLGVPIAEKDIFCTEGLRTTCGSRMLENFTPPYDSTVSARLKAAGAVLLGKTNMDEFAMGSSNETSYFGPVANPWDTGRVPGGSSGGSAVAVAAALAPAATGTDTGGSIRQPAALCGITGIKPSYGRVSRYGMVAFASSLDQGGVMTRSAEDAAILLRVIAGFDPRDATSVDRAVPDYRETLTRSLAGITIGLPAEFFGEGLSDEVRRGVDEAIAQYRDLGARTVEVRLPNSRLAVPCYYVLAPCEASSNLARYDGVRYGYRAQDPQNLIDMYEATRAEGFGMEVKRRILIGTYALSAGYFDAYYLQSLKLRRLITQDFAQAFEHCDVIAGPTAPSTAFPLKAKTDDPVAMYLNDIYTIPVNLAGLPGLSLPVGFDSSGLPIGMQLIGRYFDESLILNVAHQYQLRTEWHRRLPGGFE
ncbi:MAG: Asp-tRNA(Asn)/Glu-tRNA(Gln) amidotransferase subunit GatA [Acidiferrobacteraceae bacterium]